MMKTTFLKPFNETIEEILKEKKEKREAAINIQKAVRDMIIKNHKDLRDMFNALDTVSHTIVDSILNTKDLKERKDIRESGQEEIDRRNREIEKYLKENNLLEDYNKEHFSCDICKDTGYVKDKLCTCVYTQLAKFTFNLSNISKAHDIDSYTTDIIKDEETKSKMDELVKEVKKWIKSFDEKNSNGWVFAGSTGVGKTYLIEAISHSLINKGKMVVYQTSQNLLSTLESLGYQDREIMHDLLSTCSLLVLDDLGQEQNTDKYRSELFRIVNNRNINGKPIIISTNIQSLPEMRKRYSAPLISRLKQMCRFKIIGGRDLRKFDK